MKHITLLLFIVAYSQFVWGATINDTQIYKAKNSHDYSINAESLRVCASILGFSNNDLKEYCGGRFGDCLDIVDVQTLAERAQGNRKTIKADYVNMSGNDLKFTVTNKTSIDQEIMVTAYDPNYRVNEILELPPKSTKVYQIDSEQPLYVYAGIDIKNHYSLDRHCENKYGCLEVQDYRIDKWVSQTSGRGLGQKITPNSKGVIKFKITNNHSISTKITLYARSPDIGACSS